MLNSEPCTLSALFDQRIVLRPEFGYLDCWIEFLLFRREAKLPESDEVEQARQAVYGLLLCRRGAGGNRLATSTRHFELLETSARRLAERAGPQMVADAAIWLSTLCHADELSETAATELSVG